MAGASLHYARIACALKMCAGLEAADGRVQSNVAASRLFSAVWMGAAGAGGHAGAEHPGDAGSGDAHGIAQDELGLRDWGKPGGEPDCGFCVVLAGTPVWAEDH